MQRLLLRPTEAAEMLGFGRSKTYELIADGTIPSVTIGKSRRIPAEALRDWVRAQAGSPATERRLETGAAGKGRP